MCIMCFILANWLGVDRKWSLSTTSGPRQVKHATPAIPPPVKEFNWITPTKKLLKLSYRAGLRPCKKVNTLIPIRWLPSWGVWCDLSEERRVTLLQQIFKFFFWNSMQSSSNREKNAKRPWGGRPHLPVQEEEQNSNAGMWWMWMLLAHNMLWSYRINPGWNQ